MTRPGPGPPLAPSHGWERRLPHAHPREPPTTPPQLPARQAPASQSNNKRQFLLIDDTSPRTRETRIAGVVGQRNRPLCLAGKKERRVRAAALVFRKWSEGQVWAGQRGMRTGQVVSARCSCVVTTGPRTARPGNYYYPPTSRASLSGLPLPRPPEALPLKVFEIFTGFRKYRSDLFVLLSFFIVAGSLSDPPASDVPHVFPKCRAPRRLRRGSHAATPATRRRGRRSEKERRGDEVEEKPGAGLDLRKGDKKPA
ncbi:hypothetical protein E2C01_022688 [Portunus trituberculatus]|uniref:Uncharacterized protein n=1 Tax=Portunus trituberculatus TaxID=210409 RepID=A0A5B7E7Z2_PORTR|nr:hypothetical protein [Portunus trituberculatus]